MGDGACIFFRPRVIIEPGRNESIKASDLIPDHIFEDINYCEENKIQEDIFQHAKNEHERKFFSEEIEDD